MNVESRPEPKFKRGDFVFSGIDSHAMKIINSCYDEHWRYQIFDDVNEYWFFEKELKKVEIGDVVYSEVWKEKVIVREFCDDKFILVVNFNGKLLKSLPSLIKQIKDETKPEPKFKVGDSVEVLKSGTAVLKESYYTNDVYGADWTDEMIEGLVEEENKTHNEMCKQLIEEMNPNIKMNAVYFKSDIRYNKISINTENCSDKVEINISDDYELVEKDGKWFAVKKKPKYPQSYKECIEIIAEYTGSDCNPKGCMGYKSTLLTTFQKLLICRDAYWKIAGDWKPDWTDNDACYYAIATTKGDIGLMSSLYIDNGILVFPTEEMRDAFYEAFKELIEECKELL